MKRSLAILICAAMLLMLVLSFAGCSAKETVNEEQSKYVGAWIATKVMIGDSGTLQPIEAFTDAEYSADFKGDGLCEYTINSTTWKDNKWEETEDGLKILDARGKYLYLTANEDGTMYYEYTEDGVNVKLIFEKQ